MSTDGIMRTPFFTKKTRQRFKTIIKCLVCINFTFLEDLYQQLLIIFHFKSMLKSTSFYLFTILFISLVFGCQELYNPTLDKAHKEILVVDGGINNTNSLYTVKLHNAIGFTDNENTYSEQIETGAIVQISDDLGNSETLQDIGNGDYQSSGSIVGTPGRTYTLNIKTKNGTEYASIPEKMPEPATQILLSPEIAYKNVMLTQSSGDVYYVTQRGLNIFLDLISDQVNHSYYKFETRIIREAYHYEWRTGRCTRCIPTRVFCWYVSSLEDKPSLTEGIITNDGNILKHYNLGFLPEGTYDKGAKTVINDPPENVGSLLTFNILSIPESEYLFYSKLNEQLAANGKMFDPLPTQLKSNLKCITDSTKLVLGYFNVSSQIRKDIYLKFNQGSTNFTQKDIEPVPPDIAPDCHDEVKPSFWFQYDY